MNSLRFSLFFIVVACLACTAGCRNKLTPVEGKVLVGTQPLTQGEVTFHPDVEGGNTQSYPDLPRGTINSEGKYTLSTRGKPGAPAGKYKVTINPNANVVPEAGKEMEALKEVIEKINLDVSTTPIRIEVKSDAPAGHYDLTVKPAQ